MVDFSLAKLRHQTRKLRLRAFLDGKAEVVPSDTESPRECNLGKWIYSTGLSKYKNIPEVHQLEKTHANLHATIKNTVELKQAGDQAGAEQEFAKIEPLSKDILKLLTLMEKKIKQ